MVSLSWPKSETRVSRKTASASFVSRGDTYLLPLKASRTAFTSSKGSGLQQVTGTPVLDASTAIPRSVFIVRYASLTAHIPTKFYVSNPP